MVEHHLLRVVTADYASPVGGLLGVGGNGHRLLGCSHAIEIAENHNLDGHLDIRLAGHGDARLDVERCADGNLHALCERGVLGPYE